MTYRLIILLTILFIPLLSHAASKIKQLEVQGETAIFTLADPKSHAVPSCVSSDNQNKWAINLNSLQGQAMYSLLVTAVSKGMEVDVTSANRCEALPNVEQAAYLALNVSQTAQTAQGPALYKSDGVTKLGNIVAMPQHNSYYYVPDDGRKGADSYTLYEDNQNMLFLNAQCTGDAYVDGTIYRIPSYSRRLDLYIYHTSGSQSENRLYTKGNIPVFYLEQIPPYHEFNYTCTNSNRVASDYTAAVKVVTKPHDLCGESACIIK
ncbi:hypothetical protein PA25_36120 [Pseudoalteromonas sp. A25]|uniref:hypothetical protein n=1 Tax=Pseudoalteromonas sp. A25 TaxID=116092 RepID=UPI0012606497|nr:hypothetical protein [Pseudoalteromonas sp. A25]BBN83627.1 hypothetical protein PA25_36120 [Pseudoalteromonas sp. A25]